MKAFTRQSQANTAAERWDLQYQPGKNPPVQCSGIADRIRALGTTPNPDEVDRIIGNSSWTSVPDCSECNAEGQSVIVQVGAEPDYESETAYLCGGCLRKALALTEPTRPA